MADNYPTPPQPTLVSGTGSAVQTATDPEGNKWQFDNDKGNWVNLTTGEAVSPKIFSQMAGRSGDAARDTIALSQAMRREEASLVPARPMPAPAPAPAPAPPPMPAAAPVAPPVTQTATQAPFSPVMRPGAEGVLPPYTASEMVRVRNQRPVPSTRVPPSPGADRFYQMQQVDWLMRNRGMKPAEAMRMVGIEPGLTAASKPVHVGDALIDPRTGRAIYTAPPKSITPMQQMTVERWKRADDLKQAALEESKRKASQQLSPAAKARIKVYEDDLKTIRSKMLTETDPNAQADLNMQHQQLWAAINREFETPAAPVVTKPQMAGMEAAAPMPTDKRNLVAGRTYSTKRGLAKWDGEKFIPVR